MSHFLLDATRIKGIYSVIGTLFEKIADQIVERTYVSRIISILPKLIIHLKIVKGAERPFLGKETFNKNKDS